MDELSFADSINAMVEEVAKIESELREKALAKAIQENTFIVGSPIIKAQLESEFKGMKVLYSPYVDSSLIVIAKVETLNPYFEPLEYGEWLKGESK